MGEGIGRVTLLIPGWAGELTPEELALLRAVLKRKPALRRRWGFKTSRISDAEIRKVALEGVDDPQKSTEAHDTPLEMKLRQKRKWGK